MIGPITLPWPSKPLSPNTRQHWSVKAKYVKLTRLDTAWWVRSVMRFRPQWEKVKVAYVFHPPDKRRRDLDNLIASTKAISDGIADAIGIDDSRFIPTYSMAEPVKGGAVIVTIEQGEQECRVV